MKNVPANKKAQTPPNNNKEKEQGPKRPEKAQVPPPQATHFTVTPENLQELANCINDTVSSKWVKQTIYNALNTLIQPVFPEVEKTDEETDKEEAAE